MNSTTKNESSISHSDTVDSLEDTTDVIRFLQEVMCLRGPGESLKLTGIALSGLYGILGGIEKRIQDDIEKIR